MSANEKNTKLAQTILFRLHQTNILINIILFLTVAAAAYSHLSGGEFILTFLLLPGLVTVLGFLSKRRVASARSLSLIEVAISLTFFFLTLYGYLVEDWHGFWFQSPLFAGLVVLCVLTINQLTKVNRDLR